MILKLKMENKVYFLKISVFSFEVICEVIKQKVDFY